MKNLKSILGLRKNAAATLAIALGVTLTLSSCLKNKETDFVQPDAAALSIFHASPGTGPFNVKVGDNFISNGLNPLKFEFSQRLAYILVTPGSRKISVLKNSSSDTIKSANFDIVKDKYYSLFVVDAAPNSNFFIVEDILATPPANKARVRFVNLSPDAGNLTLVANAGADTTLFSDKPYKTATEFVNLSGTKNYKFEIKSGATSKAILENIEIRSNRTYTIWAKGLNAATVDSLKTGLKVSEHLLAQ